MRRDISLLLVVCGLTFFAGLGRPAIADSDEAFYAEAAREMLETRDWITPHYNYEVRFQKPALYYWLASAAYLAAGVSEAAARFPAALSGLGLVLLTFGIARRRYDARTGLLAGVITGSGFGYFYMARQALPDLPLAFFVALATWAGMAGTLASLGDTGSLDRSRRRAWLVVAAVAAAAGFLAKGPVGVVLPIFVVVPLLGIEVFKQRRSARSWWPSHFRFSDLWPGALVFLVLSIPWYAAMTQVHGPAYLQQFFLGENLERFATERFNEPRPAWFYLPIIAGGMLPWSPLMLLWVAPFVRVLRRTRSITPFEVCLFVWAAAPLLFFTASVGKQPRYVLPILPPLAILLARAVTRRVSRTPMEGGGRRDWLLGTAGALSGGLVGAWGLLLYRLNPFVDSMSPTWLALGAIIVCAAGIAVALIALARQRLVPVAVAAAGLLSLLITQYAFLSSAGPEPVQKMALLVLAARRAQEPIGRYRVFTRNLVFYTRVKQVDMVTDDQVTSFLHSSERVLCVIAADDLARLESRNGIHTERLGEVTYFNTLNLQLRTVVSPTPGRDLQRVLLVSNRPGRAPTGERGEAAAGLRLLAARP